MVTEQIKQPTLTTLVSKLEVAGLVSRRPDPSDGRAALLSLTTAGEMVVQSRLVAIARDAPAEPSSGSRVPPHARRMT
jgi:DNA-binding MarR family transcriptional regulator